MNEQIKAIIIAFGYEKREHGYVRDNPKGLSQAVTLWEKEPGQDYFEIQLFGWPTRSEADYKNYDTGIIGLSTVSELAVLLDVFDQYKHIDWI